MGCTQSKIENEEAVSRCKDRKQFMKDAVTSRNAFAAAHSAYSIALKNTGAALSDYGQGEVQDLHRPSQPTPQPPIENLPPPPPPLPNFSSTPLQRAASMPEFLISKSHHIPDHPDTIREEDDADDDADDNADTLPHEDEENEVSDLNLRRHRHHHSAGAGAGGGGRRTVTAEPPPPPSPPPTPPDNPPTPLPLESKGMMSWDYFFPMAENMPGPSLSEADEIRPEKDEAENGMYEMRFDRAQNGGGHVDVGGQGSNVEPPPTPEMVIEQTEMVAVKPPKNGKQVHLVHTNTAPAEVKRGGRGAPSVNLLQILHKLDDHFLRASESAHEVSKMLEATRLHYHSNFADNRGHIDHSAIVLRVITWNKTFRGLNTNDGKDDFDSEEFETHATVLDKLLAWEKKLYDEVKAGELMKLEYQRKVALLNKQKKRGASSEALERTKAAVSHLHTRYIVDMQSMDSTVSEINRLRDQQLYPKLVDLVDAMGKMWESMHAHHDEQLKIVSDLRSLDITHAPKETSQHHHDRTIQLLDVLHEWHSQFQKLVAHQKEYIHALTVWLKLNIIPIESSLKEKVSSPPRLLRPPIQALLHAWHDHLDKVPDELARTAISTFAAVIKSIMDHQQEEMKMKEKCEETRKEYMRKSRAFDDWYNKYMERHMPTDETNQDRTEDTNVSERRYAVEILKKRLEDEVEAHQKLCRQVREKSLSSLKMHLPELFRAMSDFAFASSDMYKKLQFISQSQNPTGS
ncbi:protein ALTERED PHOSPHATE STARVATION RESPONSE 1 [Macadamia integrifolia]|uniref:protein ALTERED PHOSPHATE STARVATION RESPONSE 1 n=1 Tax=Macadamia integrifolia TaxID=60698 RepID=UPI001C4F3C6A|nr:protein ALTERED PHOSPHATE STARVATION RESPONSE 1 [Macadamia integrifolia]